MDVNANLVDVVALSPAGVPKPDKLESCPCLPQGLAQDDSDVDATQETEEDCDQAGAFLPDGNHLDAAVASDTENTAAEQQDGHLEWQQAYDPSYGCLYYYRESTQVLWPH